MKSFIFCYDLSDVNFTQGHMDAFISSSKFLHSWSSAFPGCYFIKSESDFAAIWGSFHSFLEGRLFVLAEIKSGANQTNGTLNVNVWHWLNAPAENALTTLIPDLTKGE